MHVSTQHGHLPAHDLQLRRAHIGLRLLRLVARGSRSDSGVLCARALLVRAPFPRDLCPVCKGARMGWDRLAACDHIDSVSWHDHVLAPWRHIDVALALGAPAVEADGEQAIAAPALRLGGACGLLGRRLAVTALRLVRLVPSGQETGVNAAAHAEELLKEAEEGAAHEVVRGLDELEEGVLLARGEEHLEELKQLGHKVELAEQREEHGVHEDRAPRVGRGVEVGAELRAGCWPPLALVHETDGGGLLDLGDEAEVRQRGGGRGGGRPAGAPCSIPGEARELSLERRGGRVPRPAWRRVPLVLRGG
mmetsp:Transcript_9584/g.28363  ORF Transcript_9584/g.28363 Transcript_9584/m.28363 type:complete len:307 (+) Transcript_9584:428-1348(+)